MDARHISDKKNIINKVNSMRAGKQCLMNDYELDILDQMEVDVDYVSISCNDGYLVMTKDHEFAKEYRKAQYGIE